MRASDWSEEHGCIMKRHYFGSLQKAQIQLLLKNSVGAAFGFLINP